MRKQPTFPGLRDAKAVFQLHGASMSGQLKFRTKLARSRFRKFMADQPPSVAVLEACGSAYYWAREMIKPAHEVKLMAPQYVRPFVKRQKNDASDAEAIVIAAQRPEMRSVVPKSEDQQALRRSPRIMSNPSSGIRRMTRTMQRPSALP